jgi:hypothetical protein
MTHADLLSIVLRVLGTATAIQGAMFTSRYVYMLLPDHESEWFSPGRLLFAVVATTLGVLVATSSRRVAQHLLPGSRRFTNRIRGSSTSALVYSLFAILLFSRAMLHARAIIEEAASKPSWDELRVTEYLLNWQLRSVQDAFILGAASILVFGSAIWEFHRGAAA